MSLDVGRAVDRLPRRQREVTILFYYVDLSIASIADLLQCSIGTVKSSLHDARARLTHELSVMNIDEILAEDCAAWRAQLPDQPMLHRPGRSAPIRRRDWRMPATVAAFVVAACAMVWVIANNSGPLPTTPGQLLVAGATTDPMRPFIPPGMTEKPTPTVTPVASDTAGLNMPWRLAALSPDRRSITVFYVQGDGDCVHSVGFTVMKPMST